ncbi:hypothetical protein D3C76_1843790 [compost metagenome]
MVQSVNYTIGSMWYILHHQDPIHAIPHDWRHGEGASRAEKQGTRQNFTFSGVLY